MQIYRAIHRIGNSNIPITCWRVNLCALECELEKVFNKPPFLYTFSIYEQEITFMYADIAGSKAHIIQPWTKAENLFLETRTVNL